MRVFMVQLGYIYTSDRDEKIGKRKELLKRIGVELPCGDDSESKIEHPSLVVNTDQLLDLLKGEEQVTIKHEVSFGDGMERLSERLEAVVRKLEKTPVGMAEYNEKCEVHMPGNALMTFNRTLLLEHACTDELQRSIDAGWRIICAQPMPDQRRPDYIMGRFDPTYVPDGKGAARSIGQ